MAFRTRSKWGASRKQWYVLRAANGKVIGVTSIGKSVASDRRKKAKHKPAKSRQGWMGDY